MTGTRNKACAAALLALVFLLAQFHSCADLGVAGSSMHACPYCLTTGVALATNVPILEIGTTASRLEIRAAQIDAATTVETKVSPRAPPAL